MILISSGSRISRWGGGGGAEPLGGTDLRHGYFLAKMYAKTKELDPIGGWARAGGAPPGSANADDDQTEFWH